MPMLFAAGFDWLEGLLPLLFVLFWILSQVVNVIRAVGKAAQPKPLQLPQAKPPVDREMVDARRDLERQLEEFLRRRGGDEMPSPPPPPAAKPPKRRPQTQRKEPPRPSRPRDLVTPPAVPGPQATDRSLGSLGGHATEVARHVEEAFSHDLQHRSGAVPTAGTAPTSTGVGRELAALLREPASLRRLILLREVLDRPVERW